LTKAHLSKSWFNKKVGRKTSEDVASFMKKRRYERNKKTQTPRSGQELNRIILPHSQFTFPSPENLRFSGEGMDLLKGVNFLLSSRPLRGENEKE